MSVLLGIDTGGTYTDAVLLDEARNSGEQVIASAKALTTRHDLAIGIGEAIDAVLLESQVAASNVSLVSLSTTLATNALVEGQGESVCLVFIGFAPGDLDRAGLREALKDDPVIMAHGGHTPSGDPQAAIDLAVIAADIDALKTPVAGYAVASHFAVRNPEHESAVRDLIRERTGLPVTCSHELSAKLGGPKRALTSVLNARLIGLLHRLIASAEGLLADRKITAPLMVVRGDGALVSAEFAKTRPIETILSGPAASLIGAAYLTGLADAVISDIGGTTTDIAVLKDGRPRLDAEGATVGGWRTMVEAVAMYTHGLGGDSEVHYSGSSLAAGLGLGPRRAIPVSLFAKHHPDIVHDNLARQKQQDVPRELDGRFIAASGAALDESRLKSDAERRIVEQVVASPMAVDTLVTSRLQMGTVNRLVSRGLLMVSALTPSDAAHVIGLHDEWDGKAARGAAELFARQRGTTGNDIAPDAQTLCHAIIARLTRRSAEVVLDAAFAEDGFDARDPSRTFIASAALDGHRGLVRTDIGLDVPVIGLGASAATYYPAITKLLRTDAVVPTHAGVANAVGAVVGRVEISLEAIVSQPSEGRYRAHVEGAPGDFTDAESAICFALDALSEAAHSAAVAAGAEAIQVKTGREDVVVRIEGAEVFVESRVTAVASGRPRLEMN
jgi:N-methylhydantoinase A/oxoprolinase/acetone carboxylase beta subunit